MKGAEENTRREERVVAGTEGGGEGGTAEKGVEKIEKERREARGGVRGKASNRRPSHRRCGVGGIRGAKTA
jgi:hypothetical protein